MFLSNWTVELQLVSKEVGVIWIVLFAGKFLVPGHIFCSYIEMQIGNL